MRQSPKRPAKKAAGTDPRACYARLKILSASLSPAGITAAAGLPADRSWKAGDRRRGTAVVEKKHGWVVESGLPKEAPIEEHVRALLDRLAPFAGRIQELSRAHEVEFSCVVYSRQTPALNFDAATVSLIAALGASLDFDLYVG